MNKDAHLDALGLFYLNLEQAGALVAKCTYLDGQCSEELGSLVKKLPEKEYYSIYDPDLDEPFAEAANCFTQILTNAVATGSLSVPFIQYDIDESIITDETFVHYTVLYDWLESRSIGAGDFFDEYFHFELTLAENADTFVRAERERLLAKKRGGKSDLGVGGDVSDEYFLLFQEKVQLEEKLQLLEADAENTIPVSARARGGFLNIIGALLGLLLEDGRGNFQTQQSVIEAIHDKWGERCNGLSKRNIEEKFAQAKRNLMSDSNIID